MLTTGSLTLLHKSQIYGGVGRKPLLKKTYKTLKLLWSQETKADIFGLHAKHYVWQTNTAWIGHSYFLAEKVGY